VTVEIENLVVDVVVVAILIVVDDRVLFDVVIGGLV
jgi:hypothetical protein